MGMGTAMLRRLLVWFTIASVFALLVAPMIGSGGITGTAYAEDSTLFSRPFTPDQVAAFRAGLVPGGAL